MTKRLIKTSILIAMGAGFAFADLQGDIEDYKNQRAALQTELKKLDVRIAQTDSLVKEEAKRFELTQKREQDDLTRRKVELDSLQAKIAVIAKDVQSEKGRQSGQQLAVENTKAFRDGINKSLANYCKALEDLMLTSLPWELDTRLEHVRTLRRDLENGSSSAEEGLSRLRAIYLEETRFGDEVQLINHPIIRIDGETVNARILRIGNQWMVYSDDEGTKYGVLVRKLGKTGKVEYTWKEDLNFDERTAIKLAIEVKMARKPPQMVRMPLSLSIENSKVENKEAK